MDHRERLAGGSSRYRIRCSTTPASRPTSRFSPTMKPTRPRRMILVHARECGTKMRKSLGDKHKDLWPERSRDRAAVREGAGYDSNIEENPRGMSGSM